jgi:hypothetical protein
MLLRVRQLKGDPDELDGRLTVFARVDIDPADLVTSKLPVANMIHNGLLVAQGNYREQFSLRDFLRSEMGVSLDEGLEQLVSRLDGLEGALDPEKLREKLHEVEGMEEFFPTPAKIVPFHSEEELLAQEGDVFTVGAFTSASNAMLSVNAFPILYQARYREQSIENVRTEIDKLVSQVERSGESTPERFSDEGVDVAQRLVREFIPSMLYSRKDPRTFEAAERQFRSFLRGYPRQEDVNAVLTLLHAPRELVTRDFTLLELYARKIAAVTREDYGEVDRTNRQILDIERGQA